MSDEMRGAFDLDKAVIEVTTEIFDNIMEKLRHPDGKDTSYLRALFRQNGNDYGCSLNIKVTLNEYDKSASAETTFGRLK